MRELVARAADAPRPDQDSRRSMMLLQYAAYYLFFGHRSSTHIHSSGALFQGHGQTAVAATVRAAESADSQPVTAQEWLCSLAYIWEQSTLRYYRYNQDKFPTHSRCGVIDAVVCGDDNAAALGWRIVLPATFSYGPRYMHHKL